MRRLAPSDSVSWFSALVVVVACTETETTIAPAAVAPSSLVAAEVVRVIDGDTIDVLIDGQTHRVRYIGVDTPETVHPPRGVEPYGKAASERNRQLVEGETILLEKDVSETDRFDRLLRYDLAAPRHVDVKKWALGNPAIALTSASLPCAHGAISETSLTPAETLRH